MSDNEWPKCAFHNIVGHMIGSPTCHRTGGPKIKEPKSPPPSKEIFVDDSHYGKNEPQIPDGAAYWWR